MFSLVLTAALMTPGQFPYEEIDRIQADLVCYGGYGTYSGCPGGGPPLCYGPCAPYWGACYGPAIAFAPICVAGSDDGHGKKFKEIDRRFDEVKTSMEKLTESLLKLEKRVSADARKTKTQFEAADKKIQDAEKKAKRGIKKLDEKIDQRLKNTEGKIDNLDKKIENQARAAEIKALEDKIKQVQDRFSSDNQQALERKLGNLERVETDRKRDDAMLLSIDGKLDKLQGSLKREVDGIQDHLKKVDEQLKEEKDNRLRMDDRLRNLEKGSILPDKTLPREPLKESRELKEDSTLPSIPQIKTSRAGQSRFEVPANKALVVVTLPAEANLYLNNKLMRATGGVRSFFTPEIERGDSFAYVLKVETVRDARLVTETREISFQAGRTVNVSFDTPATLQTARIR